MSAQEPWPVQVRRGLRLAAIIIAVLFGAMVLGLIDFGGAAAAREGARRARCSSNLKQIGYGCHLYSSDHAEKFPPGLGDLYPDFISDGKVFICPTACRATAVEDDPGFSRHGYRPAVFGDTHADYVYVSGLRASDPKDYVLAFDEEWNHPDKLELGRRYKRGVNVLYVGANVEWTHDIDALHERLAKQEKELAAKGRKMKLLRPAWSRYPAEPDPSSAPKRRGSLPLYPVTVIAVAALAVAVAIGLYIRGRRASVSG